MPRPKCFCKVTVANCPTCSKPDYDKIRPATGVSANLLKARLHVRAA